MIHFLDKETIDKIAAGEVIERPENVLRELVDNALDSGASQISCEIRGGGLELIRVTDNGSGLQKDDIPAAFVRHATSKLENAGDLDHIRTMGFRGEALASICGVSKVELITKMNDSLAGYRYVIEGGEEKAFQEIGAPDGTTVLVKELFYNIPVRKKFLKSEHFEASAMLSAMEKYAMSYPAVSFSFMMDGRSRLHSAGNGKLLDSVYTIYGKDVCREMTEVSFEQDGISISGYAGKPVLNRAKRDYEIYFINGRFAKAPVITRAIEDAYAPYLMQHRFPFTVIHIDTDPSLVDVNIHPRKSEVRFRENEIIYQAVFQALTQALADREMLVEGLRAEKTQEGSKKGYGSRNLQLDLVFSPEPFETRRQEQILKDAGQGYASSSMPVHTEAQTRAEAPAGTAAQNDAAASGMAAQSDSAASIHMPASAMTSESPAQNASEEAGKTPEASFGSGQSLVRPKESGFLSREALPSYKYIGQLFMTYWMIEYRDSLYLIDQHAAHEKVNFERYMALARANQVTTQQLFPSILLSLSASEAAFLEDELDSFRQMGYDISHAGGNDFIVSGVPANLPSVGEKEVLMELIDSLCEERRGIRSELVKDRIATMSCKAAVKGNRPLSEAEARSLIDALLQLEDPYHCPHGRPTIAKWSKYELDRLFKRIV